MANGETNNRHFILSGFASTEGYKSPQQGGGRRSVPIREREPHGEKLLSQLESLEEQAASVRYTQEELGLETDFGLLIEFESFPDIELAFESLSRERSHIELMNVRHVDDRTYATVFVPDGKLDIFERLVGAYLQRKQDSAGRARDNRFLIDTINNIRRGSLKALWTDDQNLFPTGDQESFWWEVWLPVRGNREEVVNSFKNLAASVNIRVGIGAVTFPERTVLLAFASAAQMERSVLILNCIAELRRAKETADFFDGHNLEDQAGWVQELLDRTTFASPADETVYVCLFDTGVNNGHPLIEPALTDDDLHTVEPGWGVDDRHGHGTMMAGLAIAGDLTPVLETNSPIDIVHRLESVKLLQGGAGNTNDSRHHGYLTTEAVARTEIAGPLRHRLFSMAVTARDNRDRGRPSAWSAALDRLAADADGEGESPRLFMVSGGSIAEADAVGYPDANDTDTVHDPGQAWNVLTIGSYTDLVNITEPGDYEVIADRGGLSPFSSTSLTWERHWPIKPDVLLEGGNAARTPWGATSLPSLSLLTTNREIESRLFTTTNATSAATALAGRMGARLMAEYPELWPETIRGLVVHSASWTESMKSMSLPPNPSKDDYNRLLRRCGFGVPDIERALWSIANSLTMIVEESIYPFKREEGKDPTLREMQLHSLPWPKDVLEDLGDTGVRMRVTLSYFVEPNPSKRGSRSRYRYESHGLRFDTKRAAESIDEFRARVNAAAREGSSGTSNQAEDGGWVIGKQNRHRGSLHSDIWEGTAADLASRGVLAVYPTQGWWKTRPRLNRYDSHARYSLIVSIEAPGVDVDLYSEIENIIRVAIRSQV